VSGASSVLSASVGNTKDVRSPGFMPTTVGNASASIALSIMKSLQHQQQPLPPSASEDHFVQSRGHMDSALATSALQGTSALLSSSDDLSSFFGGGRASRVAVSGHRRPSLDGISEQQIHSKSNFIPIEKKLQREQPMTLSDLALTGSVGRAAWLTVASADTSNDANAKKPVPMPDFRSVLAKAAATKW
jgi:hypothetical protein